MNPVLVSAIGILMGLAFAGLVWWFCAGLRPRSGWQSGTGPIARWLNERRRVKFNEQLPDALATMNNALRAGLSITQALETVSTTGEEPIGGEFLLLVRQLRVGMTLEEALNAFVARVGSEDLELIASAILISRKMGGNLTELFDSIAGTIRARMRIERKVRTLTAQGRLQGIIVSAMPVFLLVIMTIIKPGMMLPFLFSAAGLMSLLAMAALITLGWILIRKIIKIDI